MVTLKPGDRVRYTDKMPYTLIRYMEGGTVADPAYAPSSLGVGYRLICVRFDDHPVMLRKLYEHRVTEESGPW